MYFFYIDESGDKNPNTKRNDPYVITAIGFHEYQWRKFEKEINECKIKLLNNIYDRDKIRLELADAEIHSTDVRIPKNRKRHPFLSKLKDNELKEIINLFYLQLPKRNISIFSVVIDKDRLHSFMDVDKLHCKAYELLLERIEKFLWIEHNKQLAVCILDNTQKQLNRRLAMKHVYFQRTATSAKLKLKHIIEIPFFVESYLSNGVQLADLCAYNIYRTFLYNDENYIFFESILPYLYKNDKSIQIEGLKLFPDDHRWSDLLERIQNKKALSIVERA